MTDQDRIEVILRFHDIEKKIEGDVDTVMSEIYKFFSSIFPGFSLASRISLTIDSERFLESCEGIFVVTPEGVATIGKIDRLSDRELVLLYLARARFGYFTKQIETDTVRIGELIDKTKSGAGTIAGRLSELCSEGYAERMGKGEYRLTTIGLEYFLNSIISKVKEMTN